MITSTTFTQSDVLTAGVESIGSGTAVIKIENLSDRKTFTLQSYDVKRNK